MLDFFKYDNGELLINKDELYVIPSAKILIEKDRGGLVPGDYDGRHKLMAKKKLMFAWWVTNVNSPGIQQGLEDEELFDNAIKSLEIPKEWNWRNDKYFIAFLDDYSTWYNKHAAMRLLKEVLISFKDTSEIVKAIRKQTKTTFKEKERLDAEDMRSLIASQNELIKVASEVPKHIERLKLLEEEVHKIEKKLKVGRGGVRITSSMEPES